MLFNKHITFTAPDCPTFRDSFTTFYKKIMINRKRQFFSLELLSFGAVLSAQQINTDALSLITKISNDQQKLAKLQDKLDQMTRDKQDAAVQAQKSADDNSTAAYRLSNAPQNKKLASQADNKAGEAKSDAKKARQTSDKLTCLNKDIAYIQKKIADGQGKLSQFKFTGAPLIMPKPIWSVPVHPIPTPENATIHP